MVETEGQGRGHLSERRRDDRGRRIDLVPFESITEEDLASTGEPDLETLRQRAAHAGPIHDDTLLYRIEFHAVKAGLR